MGDVTDESPVEGLYNPQMEGKARCVCVCVKAPRNTVLLLPISHQQKQDDDCSFPIFQFFSDV